MDKVETLEKILQKILTEPKHKLRDIEYLTGIEIDRIVLETCGNFDRNLIYEFRHYLISFSFISEKPMWDGAKKAGYAINAKVIKKHLKIKE